MRMAGKFKDRIKTGIILMIGLGLILIINGGCDIPVKILSIGVAGHNIVDTASFKGFKAGMAEFGYIEAENVRYLYAYIPEFEEKVINDKVKELLAQDVDLLLVKENPVALQAKRLVEGSDVSVLVMDSFSPVESGLVESLRHPGGNLTGTIVADNIPKSLEWLAMIVPQAKKIYIPYNPNDPIVTGPLPRLEEAASLIGIELVFQKIYTVHETIAAIEDLPDDIGAVYLVPSPTLNPGAAELSEAAIKRRIPMGTSIIESGEALMSFSTDAFSSGRNAAWIAKRILQGTKPADIPIETSEVILTINLKTAGKIGINVPDDILIQADVIIR
jgi:putative ABC transport system substrate-binding protein